ncbi:BQ2448_5686 [Microbotryum intermedium]|uniref:Small ribosomal subunit protein mS33 n=1 Tax=Microbotryum intermedium TaxID=269621 RepID=A0A238EYX6_9BASI|nr:BQ2448_5686 [Microbotryum intermedium]
MFGTIPRLVASATSSVLPNRARLLALDELRCRIFSTTFNPNNVRTGSKILKARLRGPSMMEYYGQRYSGWKKLNAQVPGLELRNIAEEQRSVMQFILGLGRLIDLEVRRRRGKVTPKKGFGRRASMKKR